jgi:hypothetical protein
MINHIRTLLLNADGSKVYAPDYPGEEFVDPDYRALVLPHSFRLIRDCLFSPTPDRVMLNYRLRQLLTLVHSCELAEFAVVQDPRITYWPTHDTDAFDQTVVGTTVTGVVGNGDLYVQGGTNLLAVSQLFHRWQIAVNGDGTVSVDRQTAPASRTSYTYTLTDGLSQQLPLAGTPLTFTFRGDAGDQWIVQTVARPLYGLPAVIEAIEQGMTDEVHHDLFGDFVMDEPYKTFNNLWLYHRSLPYRLGAVTLALAYRCDELRKGVVS